MQSNAPFLLTTIGETSIVALLQTTDEPLKKKGRAVEYRVSSDFVKSNIESGLFVDITDKVANTAGMVYALKSDLPS
jgi:hypothetical protein|tara:strand:+ start:315 stop:545 length:231 start_codon:yes stop_codon:yes gene_type:complete